MQGSDRPTRPGAVPAEAEGRPTCATCNCLDDINAKLAETGHCLDATIFASAIVPGTVDKPLITIMRSDTWKPETRRGRTGKFIPSFCPFCGLRYPEPERSALAAARPSGPEAGGRGRE